MLRPSDSQHPPLPDPTFGDGIVLFLMHCSSYPTCPCIAQHHFTAGGSFTQYHSLRIAGLGSDSMQHLDSNCCSLLLQAVEKTQLVVLTPAGSYHVDCECHSLLHQGLELSQFVTHIDSTVVTPRIWSVTACYAQDSNWRSLPYSRCDSLLH